jgi:hypothetical protein
MKPLPHNTDLNLTSRDDRFMHSFIYSSFPLSTPQIAIYVSAIIGSALATGDDTGKNLMNLELPLAHPYLTVGEEKEKKSTRKSKEEQKKEEGEGEGRGGKGRGREKRRGKRKGKEKGKERKRKLYD